VEHAVGVPEIVVAVLGTFLAGHDDDEWDLAGSEDAALSLELRCAAPLVVDFVAAIQATLLEQRVVIVVRAGR
jgi:hypothetical protein